MASSATVRVIFDWALDGLGWLGPVDSTYGEARVGPLGLVDLLEKRLGLGGRFDETLERTCRLAAGLRDVPGHWRRSFEVDPLATCRRLLRDRDQLRLAGWTGQPVSARIAELYAATANASMGLPDRLLAIVQALAVRSVGVHSIVSYTAIEHVPPLWREMFQSLRRAGVAVEEKKLEPSPTEGDLGGVRAGMQARGFVPVGDGRVSLLRCHGPLDLADEIAAALSTRDTLDGVVIVGADGVLDQALARHGVPRVGAHGGPPASSRLLSLVIETAFHPMEMSDLHALLAADPGPIPKHLAVALIDALRRSPGRRTPEWDKALANGLARVDEGKRAELEQRAIGLLSPICARMDKLPTSVLRERLGVLDGWARNLAPFVPSLRELSLRIQTLLGAVNLLGADGLSGHELRRLCGDLSDPTWPWQPAQAGLTGVASPGGVLAPASVVVWWNFSREAAPHPERLLLTSVEYDGLRAAGIEPPDPSLAMAIETDAWLRPVLQAREALILACPLTDAAGESNHPHPWWDDITASLADHRDARKLEHSRLTLTPAKVAPVALRPVVVPAERVTVASPIALRQVESPSSIEKLLGCSMSWALEYGAGLRRGLSWGPAAPGPILFGTLVDRILAQVLGQSKPSPEAGANLAAELFDQQSDNLCEDLALPQHQSERSAVRRAVVESARELLRIARKHAAKDLKTRVAIEATVSGQSLIGEVDLTWADPAVLFDLKWGKTRNAAKLETGTAIQLAAYAAMLEVQGQLHETAYFALQNQEVLAEPGGRLAADGRAPGQHSVSETWSAAVATLDRRRIALAAGQLEAPGATGDDVKAAFAPTDLKVAPPCKYCAFAGLCGRGGAR